MVDDWRVANRVKEELVKFCGELTEGMRKPTKKFCIQVLYGIQAARDVKLSNIARALKESIKLIKVENRLSRNLRKADLSGKLNDRLIEKGKDFVGRDTVIAVDISDLSKEYAKKMENLAQVRDGSCGGELKRGYWLLGVFGADVRGERIIPLFLELYSQKGEDFRSENRKILDVIDKISSRCGERGIWAMDRGGDRRAVFSGLLERGVRFVIRLKGDRALKFGDVTLRAIKLAERVRCDKKFDVVVEEGGLREKKSVTINSVKVKLPFWEKDFLRLVIVKGYSEKPLMLLTNLKDKGDEEILEIYLTRWKCDESFRFLKESYHLEDIRVRSYVALKNMVAFLQAVFFFFSVVLDRRDSLKIFVMKILGRARRFFEVSGFKYYAIADGLHWIFSTSKKGLFLPQNVPRSPIQFPLPFL